MARGIRTNATLLPTFSGNLQPQSLSSYDPKTRRNTILIAEIVPTLALIDSARTLAIPSDRYYVNLGGVVGSTQLPQWASSAGGTVTYQNWDTSDKRFYFKLDNAGTLLGATAARPIYPTGPFGTATSFAPKNASAVAVYIQFRARFAVNGDYTTGGIGAGNVGAVFTTSSHHFIQVLRNSANWEVGTCDGATISQGASSGGADSSFHDFRVRWAAGEITLYVDDALAITKTTNLPTEPLGLAMNTVGADDIDVVDYLIEWEVS